MNRPSYQTRRSVTREQWARGLRYWWLGLVGAVAAALVFEIVALIWDLRIGPISMLVFGLPIFISGFFYGERLRQLGRRSSFLRVPEDSDDRPA